ncbi:MAG: SMP-30/gluconolactonase/LRE family protein [Sphingopyxis sp.]|uniref:SMP-30/gluconolactonase/LRE family protein n=1 Tax=Sphingopyxis sp. TaxID=1908224 RepID=UPI002ABBBF71|nr:SMP-30/gluconolactonase/LRE family protein [Sphingopyxis sp.]MDZ3833533.1 SMP-30/gluconolactonase/LRE family protein [Sphingopyxis sp.]
MQATILASNLVFPESLRIRDGRLWFVDMYDGRLLSLGLDEDGPGGLREEYAARTYFGGIAFGPDGSPLIVDKAARRLQWTGGSAGQGAFADLSAHGASMLNEMLALPSGDLLVGEYGFDLRAEAPRSANIYRVDRAGRSEIFAQGFDFPNGMVLSGDGKRLFVAETIGQRISCLALSAEGERIVERREHVRFEAGRPDGLAIDHADRIWAAMIGPSSLVRVTADGKVDRQIAMDIPVYDVAVDPHRPLLYVAASRARMSDLGAGVLPRTGQILALSI